MSKEEFIKQKVEEGADEKELKALWEEYEKKFKELGFESEELSKRVERRLASYLIRDSRSLSVDLRGMLIGFKESDYGARNQYKNAKEAYKVNKEQAMQDGLVNENGQPLKQSGNDKGAVINLKNVTERGYIGLFKLKDSDKWVKGELKGNTSQIKEYPELFSEVKFKAVKGTNSTDEKYIIYFSTDTKFTTVKKLSYSEVVTLLKDNYSDCMINVSAIPDFVQKHEGQFDTLCVIKGDVVLMADDPERTKVDELTGETIRKASVIGINSGNDYVGGIAHPELEFNFVDDAQDVIVIGRPSINKRNDEPMLNVYGIKAPKNFELNGEKKFEKPEEKEVQETKDEKKNVTPEEDW